MKSFTTIVLSDSEMKVFDEAYAILYKLDCLMNDRDIISAQTGEVICADELARVRGILDGLSVANLWLVSDSSSESGDNE